MSDELSTLQTLVDRLDECRGEFDAAALPESVREMLVYIDVQCRALVNR